MNLSEDLISKMAEAAVKAEKAIHRLPVVVIGGHFVKNIEALKEAYEQMALVATNFEVELLKIQDETLRDFENRAPEFKIELEKIQNLLDKTIPKPIPKKAQGWKRPYKYHR